MNPRSTLTVFAVALGMTSTATAKDHVFESGLGRTHLIELYTSQGCSSCPPAEAWLSKLKSERGLWKDFAPIAFHVDYWDRLGWRDPYASKEWTARQYQYSSSWKSESVYTPGFVLDGREMRERYVPAPAAQATGILKVSLLDGKMSAQFVPTSKDLTGFDFHVASLGFDLKTRVTAGENNGRNLAHDFVVLSLVHEKMPQGKVTLTYTPQPNAGAMVAWVTSPNELVPIQAVGGWLR